MPDLPELKAANDATASFRNDEDDVALTPIQLTRLRQYQEDEAVQILYFLRGYGASDQ